MDDKAKTPFEPLITGDGDSDERAVVLEPEVEVQIAAVPDSASEPDTSAVSDSAPLGKIRFADADPTGKEEE